MNTFVSRTVASLMPTVQRRRCLASLLALQNQAYRQIAAFQAELMRTCGPAVTYAWGEDVYQDARRERLLKKIIDAKLESADLRRACDVSLGNSPEILVSENLELIPLDMADPVGTAFRQLDPDAIAFILLGANLISPAWMNATSRSMLQSVIASNMVAILRHSIKDLGDFFRSRSGECPGPHPLGGLPSMTSGSQGPMASIVRRNRWLLEFYSNTCPGLSHLSDSFERAGIVPIGPLIGNGNVWAVARRDDFGSGNL